MNTLLLDQLTWDLVLDSSGNIAMASEPYSLAQDAASACRLFEGELWYDTTQGVPYWQSILGQMPPLALLKASYETAAKSVPDVKSVNVYIAAITRDRVVSGQVQLNGPGNQLISLTFTSLFETLTNQRLPFSSFTPIPVPPVPPHLPEPSTFTLNTSFLDGPDILG